MANTDRGSFSVVPDGLRNVVAIVRVSKEGGRGEDLLSPDMQRAAISGSATRRGWRIVDWVEAVDQSGSQRRSAWWPTLFRTIERVESGEIGGIVAWKFSRYARNRLKWAMAVERIEDARGILESATEQIDATTAAGKFHRGITAEANAFQADLIGETWRETAALRIARGLPANGRPRFGYAYDRETGFVPDPVTGPVLAAAYRRYVAGESFYSLVGWLRQLDVRPADYGQASTGEWTTTTLRRMLDHGFGAGLLNKHDPTCHKRHQSTGNCSARVFLPGSHEPVIDAVTWRKYQAARAERGQPQAAKSERSPYLLSGWIRCMTDVDGAPCNGRMGYRRPGPEVVMYCQDAQAKRRHKGGYATAKYVEDEVMTEMRKLADDVEDAVARAGAAQADRGQDIAVLDGQIAAAEADLERKTRDFLSDLIPRKLWPQIKAEAEGRLVALERKRERLAAAGQDLPELVAAQALEDWETLAVEVRRSIIRRLFEPIEVTPGHHLTVAETPNKARRAVVRVVRRGSAQIE